MNYAQKLNETEDLAIAEFRKTPVLSQLEQLSNADLRELLLQRRHISMQFMPLYDKALAFVENPRLESALKWLIKEEYRSDEINHRKALVQDLQKIGLSKEAIVRSQPTEGTRRTIHLLHQGLDVIPLVDSPRHSHSDLGTLLWLRTTMETLPGEEYELIVKEILKPEREFEITKDSSVFYVSHRDHDRKDSPLYEKSKDSMNHSHVIGACLTELVCSDADVAFGNAVIQLAIDAKQSFYKQFE